MVRGPGLVNAPKQAIASPHDPNPTVGVARRSLAHVREPCSQARLVRVFVLRRYQSKQHYVAPNSTQQTTQPTGAAASSTAHVPNNNSAAAAAAQSHPAPSRSTIIAAHTISKSPQQQAPQATTQATISRRSNEATSTEKRHNSTEQSNQTAAASNTQQQQQIGGRPRRAHRQHRPNSSGLDAAQASRTWTRHRRSRQHNSTPQQIRPSSRADGWRSSTRCTAPISTSNQMASNQSGDA